MSDNTFHHVPVYSADSEFTQIASHKVFGFWIYLMSDCILFATLFTTFAVLSPHHIEKNIFNLHHVLIETFLLLTSSFTFGLAIHSANSGHKKSLIFWIFITFVLGLSFVIMEMHEFYQLILNGHGPDQNAFLSSFFTLVGTHGLHVFFGLIWLGFMLVQVIKKGVTLFTKTRLILLSLFWHFLDIIWICIFTFVYLMGSL